MTFLRILFAVAAIAPALLHAEVWTAESAVAVALEHNPDVRIALHRIEGAKAMLDQADAAWLPQVSISGGYVQSNDALNGLMSALRQRNFDFGLDFNHPGRVDDLNVTGTISYNLYSGGRATALREAARAGARATEQELAVARQQLAAQVVTVMLNLRKARESAASLEASVKAQEASLANARQRFEAGKLLKADLLGLEVRTAQTRTLLAAAKHGVALAGRTFRYILGSDSTDEPIELADPDTAIAGLVAPDSLDFSRRPEIAGLQERLAAAEAAVAAARGGNRPSVNAFVSAQYDRGWHYDRDADSVTGGVRVDMNVFDGGETAGKVRQARAELEIAKEQLRRTNLALGLEVERARLAHADAAERLAVTEIAVKQAEESAALSRARFEKGALLASDLISAESRLLEMQLSHTVAVADERTALVELHRALGIQILPQP